MPPQVTMVLPPPGMASFHQLASRCTAGLTYGLLKSSIPLMSEKPYTPARCSAGCGRLRCGDATR